MAMIYFVADHFCLNMRHPYPWMKDGPAPPPLSPPLGGDPAPPLPSLTSDYPADWRLDLPRRDDPFNDGIPLAHPEAANPGMLARPGFSLLSQRRGRSLSSQPYSFSRQTRHFWQAFFCHICIMFYIEYCILVYRVGFAFLYVILYFVIIGQLFIIGAFVLYAFFLPIIHFIPFPENLKRLDNKLKCYW